MQSLRSGTADSSGTARDQSLFAGEIKHFG
jgi:hypothetical protein